MDTQLDRAPSKRAGGQRADGRFASQYRDASGKRQTVYGTTKAEAKAKRDAAVSDRDRGIRPITRRHTVGSWIDTWIDQLPDGRLRPRSEKAYRVAVAHWQADPIARVKLADLGPEHIGATLARWRKAGVSPRAQAFRLAILRTAFDGALVARHLAVNYARDPWTKAPKAQHAPIVPPDATDQDRLRAAMIGHPLAAAFQLGLDAGLRQGEILALRIRDLELGPVRSWVTVSGTLEYGTDHRGAPKSRHGHRRLPISQSLATALAVHLAGAGSIQDRDAFVFVGDDGRPLRAWTFLRAFRVVCAKAKVRPYRFHDLRHAFVTNALQRGIDMTNVSRYVGHSTIDMTVDQYGHIAIGSVE